MLSRGASVKNCLHTRGMLSTRSSSAILRHRGSLIAGRNSSPFYFFFFLFDTAIASVTINPKPFILRLHTYIKNISFFQFVYTLISSITIFFFGWTYFATPRSLLRAAAPAIRLPSCINVFKRYLVLFLG